MDIEKKITEQPSHYDHLERMSVGELLEHINDEDLRVAEADVLQQLAYRHPFQMVIV
jgi:N-acetylmuramic acid 6-phosphate (MurNAc-6-P) etherase